MLKTLSRIILGALYLFSGFVKAVDPVGGAIKISEYLEIVGLHNLGYIAVIFAILLSTIEFILGFQLFFAFKTKKATLPTMLFMAFFTILTLYSAIYSPVSDCGCFGDAVKLSNWETFFKNLFLLPLAVYLFLARNKFQTKLSPFKEGASIFFGLLFILSISYYGLHSLPVLDFRPFKIGTNIPQQMIIPEGEAQPQYSTTFILSKNGEQKEFTTENYPYEDSTWVFVETKTVLVQKGYQPPIDGFMLETTDGEQMGESILASEQPVFLMIMPKVEKASTETIEQFIAINHICIEKGYAFYGVTSSSNEAIMTFDTTNNAGFDYLVADETFLKTIIRDNPGLMILQKGTILAKYSHLTLPNAKDLKEPLAYTIKSLKEQSTERLLVIWTSGFLFLLLLIYRFK